MGIAETLNGLSEIIQGRNPVEVFPPNPTSRFEKIFSTVLPRTGDSWLRAFPELYSLASDGLNYVSKNPGTALDALGSLGMAMTGNIAPAIGNLKKGPASELLKGVSLGDATLPYAHEAEQWAKEQKAKTLEFSGRLAGEPIDERLINFDDPVQMAANWATLGLTTLANAPSFIKTGLAAGANKLRTGIEAIDKTGEISLKTLEVLSPMMLQKATPGVAAFSVGLPGAAGVALESAGYGPQAPAPLTPPTPAPQQQIQGKLDEAAAQATDVAVSGIKEAEAQVQAQAPTRVQQAGFSTGEPWADAGLVALTGLSILAGYKHAAVKRAFAGIKGSEDTAIRGDTAFRSNIVDSMEGMKSPYHKMLEEIGHPDPKGQSIRFANRIDESTGAAIGTKMENVHTFGTIPGSKVTFTPTRDIYTLSKQLDPAQYEVLKDGVNARRVSSSTPVNALLGTELNNRMVRTTSDPATRAIMDQYEGVARKMLDYALEQGRITPKMHADKMRNDPYFFMRGHDEGRVRTGKNAPQTVDDLKQLDDPIANMHRYIDSTVRSVEFNKVASMFLRATENARAAGSKTAKDMLGRNLPQNAKPNDKFYMYYDNGVQKSVEINDAVTLRALKQGYDLSRLHAIAGSNQLMRVLSGSAHWFQQSATGVIAAAIGQPFAHTAALYAAGVGSVMRPKGVAAGPVDKMLQMITNGKLGVPGDPTLALYSVPIAFKGMSAIAAQRLAQALHDSVITNGYLAKNLPTGSADAMANGLSNYYKRSWVGQMHEMGLLGPAIMEGIDPSRSLAHVRASASKFGAAKDMVSDTFRFANDMLHAISSSPTGALFSLNKGMEKHKLASAVRNFTGDPGKSGAFRGVVGESVGHLAAASSWGNIYLQSTDRFLRYMLNPKTAPKGLMAMTNAVGIPAIGISIWNASLGPEYTEYQLHKRPSDRAAASIYLGLPWAPPEQGLEIPIDPWMRPYKSAVEMLTATWLGLFDNSIHQPTNRGFKDALTEMVRGKWQSFGEGSVFGSVIDQSVIPPVPPAVAAGLAMTGTQWRNYGEMSPIPENKKAGFTESTARNPSRTLLGLSEAAEAEHVVRSLGANAAHLAYNVFMDGVQRFNEDKPILKNAVQQIKLGSQDSMKVGSGLLGAFAAISPSQESSSVVNREKLGGMQKMIKSLDAIAMGGVVHGGSVAGNRTRGMEPKIGGSTAITPPDMETVQLAQQAKQYYGLINQTHLPEKKRLYEQRQSVQISTRYSPERKREIMNNISDAIIKNEREMLATLRQFEMAASSTFGREIRLEQWNRGKGMEQFAKLPQ